MTDERHLYPAIFGRFVHSFSYPSRDGHRHEVKTCLCEDGTVRYETTVCESLLPIPDKSETEHSSHEENQGKKLSDDNFFGSQF